MAACSEDTVPPFAPDAPELQVATPLGRWMIEDPFVDDLLGSLSIRSLRSDLRAQFMNPTLYGGSGLASGEVAALTWRPTELTDPDDVIHLSALQLIFGDVDHHTTHEELSPGDIR